VFVLLAIALLGWRMAERARREAVMKQETVEALMTGQGVVVEGQAAAESPKPTPAPASAPPPAAIAPGLPPPMEPSVISQIRLRASRKPTGRQIARTELPAYEFSAWVEGPPAVLDRIESIQYEFNHPTFRQKLQIGRNRETGFPVGYTGWGCLSSVAVTIRLRDSSAESPHVDFDMCAAIEQSDTK
jgi:hypothetical protein